ncbi:hypothetical protein [Rummeliibacillus sp. TYF-LIM-RU47]|uniref:hypothetical protein n=1 Tax=Rummeliibacillus sp. TYF-LIM-RU47 TaxID=2608406 RepID=UPI00123AEBD2|nr:hypothetical protein [Rummeliibacillus sp. TYF-LIM-RU47]
MGLVKPQPPLKGTLTPSFIRRMKELPHVTQPLNKFLTGRYFVSRKDVINGNEVFYTLTKNGTNIEKIFWTEDGIQIRTKVIFSHPEGATIGRFDYYPQYGVIQKINGQPIYFTHDGIMIVTATTNYVDINSILKNNLLLRINSGSILDVYTPNGIQLLSFGGYFPNSATLFHDDDEHVVLTYGDGSRYTNTLLKMTLAETKVIQYISYGSSHTVVKDYYSNGGY